MYKKFMTNLKESFPEYDSLLVDVLSPLAKKMITGTLTHGCVRDTEIKLKEILKKDDGSYLTNVIVEQDKLDLNKYNLQVQYSSKISPCSKACVDINIDLFIGTKKIYFDDIDILLIHFLTKDNYNKKEDSSWDVSFCLKNDYFVVHNTINSFFNKDLSLLYNFLSDKINYKKNTFIFKDFFYIKYINEKKDTYFSLLKRNESPILTVFDSEIFDYDVFYFENESFSKNVKEFKEIWKINTKI